MACAFFFDVVVVGIIYRVVKYVKIELIIILYSPWNCSCKDNGCRRSAFHCKKIRKYFLSAERTVPWAKSCAGMGRDLSALID